MYISLIQNQNTRLKNLKIGIWKKKTHASSYNELLESPGKCNKLSPLYDGVGEARLAELKLLVELNSSGSLYTQSVDCSPPPPENVLNNIRDKTKAKKKHFTPTTCSRQNKTNRILVLDVVFICFRIVFMYKIMMRTANFKY